MMVPEPPSEDAMPLPSDLDPEADQAVQGLLRIQPGLAMPETVRIRILSTLSDEAATRAALFDNDADPTPPVTFTKTSEQERQKLG
ncbi:MAG: hypothetical protein KIT69_05555 [Propionibacteriaceae bacterium]|nr:hypothetical protein [Propionibacteriaceae bacterium]